MAPTPNRRNSQQTVNQLQSQIGLNSNMEHQTLPSTILTLAPPSPSIPQSLISQFSPTVQSLQTSPSQVQATTITTPESLTRNFHQDLSPDSSSNPTLLPTHAVNQSGREEDQNSQGNLRARNNLIRLGQYEYIVQPFHVAPHVFNNPPNYTRTIIEFTKENLRWGRIQ
ncbi:hypothetical protein Salat_0165700 [Sesamum alatum]|uniref:Uncharacterized protein n=1 Tax=Sesamum alatum TaxID=300844 RepID=A0AAE1YXL7_9LAMI|nr:hypothetical protein Salat_0165700 [Sesamum alatum]